MSPAHSQSWKVAHSPPITQIYISFPHLFISVIHPLLVYCCLLLTKTFNSRVECARAWQALDTGKQVPGPYHRVTWLLKYRSEKNNKTTIPWPSPLPEGCKVSPLLTVQCYAYPKCEDVFMDHKSVLFCRLQSPFPECSSCPFRDFSYFREHWYFPIHCSCHGGCIPQWWYQSQNICWPIALPKFYKLKEQLD